MEKYIIDRINSFLKDDKKVFATSSFQSQSLPLLHIISQVKIRIPIIFLNTGFHFPESLKFKEQVTDLLNLNVWNISSSLQSNKQKDDNGNFHYIENPNHCCYINKVKPLSDFMSENSPDVWISGIRSCQTHARKKLSEIEKTTNGIIRYHPLLRWSDKKLSNYIKKHNLPSHPLNDFGYYSIGCKPCTSLSLNQSSSNRENRWFGTSKTECGLHTTLIKKSLN